MIYYKVVAVYLVSNGKSNYKDEVTWVADLPGDEDSVLADANSHVYLKERYPWPVVKVEVRKVTESLDNSYYYR